MEQLNIIANFYFNLGFNITHISLNESEYHKNLKTTLYHWDKKLKAPSHNWEDYYKKKQTLSELNSFNWQNANGLGVVLGIENLRALDIDDCDSRLLIFDILKILELPLNYEWVVRSGSKKGFHILFYAPDHDYPTEQGKIKAFKPNLKNINKFKHIELRWIGHLVLPPSIHPTFNRYEFVNKVFPYSNPKNIEIKALESVVNKYCRNTDINEVFTSDNSLTSDLTKAEKTLNSSSPLINNINIEESNNASAVYLDKEEIIESIDTSSKYIDDEEIELQSINIAKNSIIDYQKPFYLFFDTETSGLPKNWNAAVSELNNWPRLVQLAYLLFDFQGNKISGGDFIIKPDGFLISPESSQIHGITTDRALQEGELILPVLQRFNLLIEKADYLVAHNMSFDDKIISSEFFRNGILNNIHLKNKICTMEKSTQFCAIQGPNGHKWPKLSELYYKLFRTDFEDAHNATADINATAKCFWELKRLGEL